MKLNSKNAAFSIGILIATLLVLIALSQSRLGNGNSASPLQSTVAGKGTTEIPPKQESSENEQPLTSGAMDKGSEVNDFLGVQSLSDISEEFTTAEDALAAYTAAELALDLGYESFSNWAKIELSGTCSLTLIDVEHTDDITAWANERIKEKCASFDQAMLDEINSSFSDIVEKHPRNMAQRELDLLTDTNPEQARDIIFDAFSRASTPYELGVAVNAFMNRENEPVVASLMADDRLRVGYAVEMLTRCKVFSGCDADSFLVLSNCLNMGQCLEGWNMLDFLENNFTPIQMEYARQIAAMLMAQRFAQR